MVGQENFYNIIGDQEGKSPLTGETKNFKIAEIEVFEVNV